MTTFLKVGNVIRAHGEGVVVASNALLPQVYVLKEDMQGLFLEEVENLKLPSKTYGGTQQRAERVMTTFLDRPASTGVHLNGNKGSGKTLLLKALSVLGQKQGIPTILVNAGFGGDGFSTFMQSIDQPCIVAFDEFEKNYDEKQQASILTMMDGVLSGKKLFVLTTNDEYRVSNFLKNRPGRIFYRYNFDSLGLDVIREVAEDLLKDKGQIDPMLRYAKRFPVMNFDMLMAAIEEMNRYSESFKDVLGHLNISGEADKENYRVTMQFNEDPVITFAKKYSAVVDEDFEFEFNLYTVSQKLKFPVGHVPVKGEINPRQAFTDRYGDDDYITITADDLLGVSADDLEFTFKKEYGGYKITVVFTKLERPPIVGMSEYWSMR